jgi:hypothetical protein
MIDPIHLTKYVIRPVLKDLGLYSENAEKLVLGTACVESDCGRWLKQLGDGPALGIYQMEPATHDDIWENYLDGNRKLSSGAKFYIADYTPRLADEMISNLAYATAMCRVHYLRFADPIPDNLPGQAAYWKRYYNTPLGKGTVEDYITAWRRLVPYTLTNELTGVV